MNPRYLFLSTIVIAGWLLCFPLMAEPAQGGNLDLSGEWICIRYCPAGGEGKTARIYQEGRKLHFTNEGGMKAEGEVSPDQKSVTATEWGITAKVSADAQQLEWSNSTVWTRSLDRVIAKAGKADIYGIHFDIDKADIKPESKPALEAVVKLLRQDPSLHLEVGGHTDNTGSAAHNQTLSQRRAQAVMRALITQYGIDSTRLRAKGYGATQPVADNTTAEGKAENRRVELKKI